jgi:hypothetical protein
LHKGIPLVWMSDTYTQLGFPALAKRYLMLTLCEDAFRRHGVVSPEETGIYFRLVWAHGEDRRKAIGRILASCWVPKMAIPV